MDLAGKNVVYLGGFGGIGQKCIPELLGKQLKALAIFDLNKNEESFNTWQKNYASTVIFYHQVDITKKSAIEEAFKATTERIGHFDVVINGFGLMDDRHIELTIQINLLGVVYSSFAALNYMSKEKGGKGGSIVNISSVAGLEPTALMAVYSAAKTGVTAFTRCMASPAYAASGVNFITICPGFTDTPLLDDMSDKITMNSPTVVKLSKIKRQSPDVCAANIIKVIEKNENGAVWILELGEIKQIEFPIHWRPQFLEQ